MNITTSISSSTSSAVSLSAATAAASVSAASEAASPSSAAFVASAVSENVALYHMRIALTITHLLLVSLGTVNMLVIVVIICRPYMRSITNVYMIGLCLADFIYLVNLTLVAATQLNNKSWAFGSFMCTLYHGTESTGKYASVMFVVLLAADRYCAMCRVNLCARYRNYRTALLASAFAWTISIGAAIPLYIFADVAVINFPTIAHPRRLCIAKWPSSDMARWYITFSSILIFAVPLVLIVFFYYHILDKLREALKGSKRLQRASSSRAPYHRVTRLVLWVVVFHVICWSPFWLFNLFSSILRLRIQTQLDRIVINVIHLFPYVNCALNPLLYAIQAENFRTAFRSLFLRRPSHSRVRLVHNKRSIASQASCYRPDAMNVRDPLLKKSLMRNGSTEEDHRMACKKRNHSVFKAHTIINRSNDTSILSMDTNANVPCNGFITSDLSECKNFHDQLTQRTSVDEMNDSVKSAKRVSLSDHIEALQQPDQLTPIYSEKSTDELNDTEERCSVTNIISVTSLQSSISYGPTML